MPDNPILEAALQYAGRGWRVFAVSRTKIPFKGTHGHLDATTDPAAIRAMFAGRRRRGANVALATGDLIVFDCDGDAGLRRFLELGKGDRTLVARTPSGGWHFFYKAPPGVVIRSKNERRKDGSHSGLDIKGTGGFVLLSPSMTEHGAYRWAVEVPPIELPDYLQSFAESIGAERTPDAQPLRPLPPHLVAYRLPDSARLVDRALAGFEIEWTAHEHARIWSALNSIGNDIGYDDFLKIGFSLHSLNWVKSDGTDAGFELWDQWAALFPESYNLAGLEKKWESFGRNDYSGARIGIGSLFALAQEYGWTGAVVVPPQSATAPGPSPAVQPAPWGTFPSSGNAPQPPQAPAAPAAPNGTAVALPQQFLANAIVFPDTDRNGNPKATCRNAVAAIGALGVECSKDVFHEQMLVAGHSIQAWAGDLTDDAVAMLRAIIEKQYAFDPGERNTRDAAVRLCLLHQFNPVTDYLAQLQWDGTPRLTDWVLRYLGAPDTPLHREFGKLMMVAAVRRARNPGCKFDQIIVLEGPQGIGKSSAVRLLAGADNYSDQHIMGASDREQQEAFRGVWLHEIAELAGMRRTDIERIKLFARRTEDRARPAYGRFRIDVKRRGIFVATTNEQAYLKEWDRAFWPILCGTILLRELARDRDQLWAEAATLESRGYSLELPESLRPQAAEQIAARQEIDSWEDAIVTSIMRPADAALRPADASIFEILTKEPFHFGLNEITQANQNRVSRILKKLGFERYQRREGEKREWRYRLPVTGDRLVT